MPAQGYLKEAAAALMRAALELRNDATSLRNDADKMLTDAKHRADDLKGQAHLLERQVMSPNTEPPEKAAIGVQARNYTKEASETEANANKERQLLLDQATNLEQKARGYEEKAKALEQDAAA